MEMTLFFRSFKCFQWGVGEPQEIGKQEEIVEGTWLSLGMGSAEATAPANSPVPETPLISKSSGDHNLSLPSTLS